MQVLLLSWLCLFIAGIGCRSTPNHILGVEIQTNSNTFAQGYLEFEVQLANITEDTVEFRDWFWTIPSHNVAIVFRDGTGYAKVLRVSDPYNDHSISNLFLEPKQKVTINGSWILDVPPGNYVMEVRVPEPWSPSFTSRQVTVIKGEIPRITK